jgi:MFS family permease
MAIGGITFLVSMFMISLCSNYWQLFLAQGLLQGIGSAFMTCPCLATVGKHFVKHKGLASGFMISGSSLGGVVWPIMLNELLNKHGLSFGWTIRILAFTMIPLVIVACSFVLPPKVVKADHEEGRETTKEDEEEKTKKKVDLSSIKDPKFGTFAAGIGIYYLGMFGPCKLYFPFRFCVWIG